MDASWRVWSMASIETFSRDGAHTIDALLSPGKGLTSWLSFVMSNCEVAILGQVWCLIVSIPELCPLSYLHLNNLTPVSDVSNVKLMKIICNLIETCQL